MGHLLMSTKERAGLKVYAQVKTADLKLTEASEDSWVVFL